MGQDWSYRPGSDQKLTPRRLPGQVSPTWPIPAWPFGGTEGGRLSVQTLHTRWCGPALGHAHTLQETAACLGCQPPVSPAESTARGETALCLGSRETETAAIILRNEKNGSKRENVI